MKTKKKATKRHGAQFVMPSTPGMGLALGFADKPNADPVKNTDLASFNSNCLHICSS